MSPKAMDNSSLTPIELGENPELGALEILKTTLLVAELALLATYPDICEHRASEQEAYARAILYQFDALGAMLEEYVASIRRLEAWRNRGSSEEGIPF